MVVLNNGSPLSAFWAKDYHSVRVSDITFVKAYFGNWFTLETVNVLDTDHLPTFTYALLDANVECDYRARRKNYAKTEWLAFFMFLDESVTNISVKTSHVSPASLNWRNHCRY